MNHSDRSISRRHLLHLAAALGATASFPVFSIASKRDSAPNYRTIPSTGASLPCMGLGSWITFNVGQDPLLLANSVEVMRAFFQGGGRMIDSSPMYGSSQNTIGHGLRELETYDQVFSTDKVWTGSASDGPEQLERSRQLWGVDQFSLMQVHNLVAWESHLPMLLGMKEEGKLGYVGITTSHGRRHEDMEQIMDRYPIDFIQLTYNVVDREVENRLLPKARDNGIGVIVNRPFQRGYLPERLEKYPLPGLAGDLGASTWAQLLLKYILAHPAVTCVIPATTRPEHVRENLQAGSGPLPTEAQRKQLIRYLQSL